MGDRKTVNPRCVIGYDKVPLLREKLLEALELAQGSEKGFSPGMRSIFDGFLNDIVAGRIELSNQEVWYRLFGYEKRYSPRTLIFQGVVRVEGSDKPLTADDFVRVLEEETEPRVLVINKTYETNRSFATIFGRTSITPPRRERELRYHDIRGSDWRMRNTHLLAELGESAETTLHEIFTLVRRQNSGQSGALVTNGDINRFFVRDGDGALRYVDVQWPGEEEKDYGWVIGTMSFFYESSFSASRVFSRKE